MCIRDSSPRRRLCSFSTGEMIKYQFAFAAAYRPKVLLMDEPTANLDPVFRDDFLKLLQEFVAEYEMTILPVSYTHLYTCVHVQLIFSVCIIFTCVSVQAQGFCKGNNYRLLDYPRNHQRLCAFKPCHTVWLY